MKYAIRYGVSRGLFSNEAGMGSTPHAHALAHVKDPSIQGFVACQVSFVDLLICFGYGHSSSYLRGLMLSLA